MLASVLWILLMGFFAGQIARRLGAPPLIGMILVGVILGPQAASVLSSEVLDSADSLRLVAVTIILMKAGLGLDREKLVQQSSVALRLGFLPAACEAIAITFATMAVFRFDFPTGLLLGCIIGAESPAVIVPGMLRLKSLGWGVAKGIPDAILVGSALSDVLLLLVFSLLLNFFGRGGVGAVALPGGVTLSAVQVLPFQVLLEIGLGILIGYGAARATVSLLVRQKWTQNGVQDSLLGAGIALLLVLGDKVAPYSGYLAVMAMGYFLVELDGPLARRLRSGFDSLWVVAEIVLFVLLGASVELGVLENVLLPGLLVLAVGLFVGRSVGWYFSTAGSNWNWRERLFLLPGNMAKATVQAAIGAIPLAEGVDGGEVILAMAVLSILTTAPIGAWGTAMFAPRLLERGEVDPAKVAVVTRNVFLAAVDASGFATAVLKKAGSLVRQGEGEVVVLHVVDVGGEGAVARLSDRSRRLLSDIRYRFITVSGSVPEEIIRAAEFYGATDIVMGKRGHQPWEKLLVGSTSRAVLESSSIPVIFVEERG
jgi:NhaP-type Na+/H+ or K+/H+ antiporter